MWKKIKPFLERFNTWYDSQDDQSRFWVLALYAILTILTMKFTGTFLSLVFTLGIVTLLVTRWLHLKKML